MNTLLRWFMALLMILIGANLIGCSSVPQVQVQVPCKTKEIKRPVFATETLTKDSSLFDKVKALLAEREQRIAYELELEASIEGCK